MPTLDIASILKDVTRVEPVAQLTASREETEGGSNSAKVRTSRVIKIS